MKQVLASKIRACHACHLRATAKAPVPGWGNPHAKLLVVGEAPGANEDAQGIPFVGKAGAVYDQLLSEAGIVHTKIYTTNVVKCMVPIRGTKGRTPAKDEIAVCSRWLKQEIKKLQPKVILTLGNVPLQLLTDNPKLRITREHGREYKCKLVKGDIPIIPTYHPSFLLRRDEGRDYINAALQDFRLAWLRSQGKKYPHLKKAWKGYYKIENYEVGMEPLEAPRLGFDLETFVEQKGHPTEVINVCGSICTDDRVIYFPPEKMKHYVRYFLKCRGVMTGHAISNDLLWLMADEDTKEEQVRKLLQKQYCCSLVLCYLYDHRIEPKGLKYLAEVKCRLKMLSMPFERDPREGTPKKVRRYNCCDSWSALQLANWFLRHMDKKRRALAEWMCFDVLPHMTYATFRGMKVSKKRLAEVTAMYEEKERKAFAKAHRIAPSVDLGSTDAIFHHVFGKLGLPLEEFVGKQEWKEQPEWSPSAKKPAWNKIVKRRLRKQDETGFVKQVMRRDKNRKFSQTYCRNLRNFIAEDGCVHPRFLLAKVSVAEPGIKSDKGGTKTGRPIMKEPSFATFPRWSPIKSIIVSRFSNGLICTADYEQVELRVGADIVGCETMLDIFSSKKYDIHTFTAAEVLEKKYKSVTEQDRDLAGKTPNFAIIFGVKAWKLSRIYAKAGYKVSRARASRIIERWHKRYPEFRDYHADTEAFVIEHGYIESPTGRREYILANRSSPEGRQGIRMAVNQRIQAGASDLCSAAIGKIGELSLLPTFWRRFFIIGDVYDSIVIDHQQRLRRKVEKMLPEICCDAESLVGHLGWHLSVPLEIDLKFGKCLAAEGER